jgi:rod shape-determining protein MreD
MSVARINSGDAVRLRDRAASSGETGAHRGHVDAEVFVPPSFWLLVALAALVVVAQATFLDGFALRGGRLSLLTVLVVWTGLRCGVTTGAWLGLIGGLLEDALGGGGQSVLGATLAGFLAGTLSNRFFSDSIPVFAGAVAAATVLRATTTYLIAEIAFGERGLFHRMSHETAWQILVNCAAAVAVLVVLRVMSHALPPRAR